MKKTKEKLMIIDGNALIHRSFHALPPTMMTKSGEMTNAVYGFTTVLLKAIREFKPEHIVLTLDKKGPTFRHEQYKEYKAHRAAAPDDLYAQIPRVKEVAASFNIPIFEESGCEADDLIGTISRIVGDKMEKIIVTGDMDTLQLVNNSTKVYTMSRGLSDSVIYDETAVFNRFGLKPEQMIEYKALRGDPSDNIPGVKGIGEKGAIDLLKEFKTLDGIYKNIESDKIKDRTRTLLQEQKNEAYMSRDLATIRCNIKIAFNEKASRFIGVDQEKVTKLFSELEFKSLLPRVHAILAGKETKAVRESIDKFERDRKEFKYILIDDEKKFAKFFTLISKQKNFTFDTETSDCDPLLSELLGISFSWKAGEAYYLNLRNKKKEEKNLFNYNSQSGSKNQNAWLEKLAPIFSDKKIKKSAHNAKFDLRVLKNQNLEIDGIEFDTMIASYLLNPGSRQHNLDAVTFSEMGFEKISKDDLLGKGRERITFGEVPVENLSLYSCEDADFTNRLVKKLGPQLKENKLEKLFTEIEMPLIPVLAQMEDNGIIVDKVFLAKMNKSLAKRLSALEAKIYKEAGQEFNINSTQQLREVLFTSLIIPTEAIKKTKTGLSTAADELEKLKDFHPIIKLIQEYRELTKLISTYISALPELINKKTGRLHTCFNQTITATGRLSSTEPNLQNIPVRTELGREIRKAFVADKGCILVSFDYSQIELRLAAHMSGDKKMIVAFKNDEDIHAATAAEINSVDLKDVTKEMRREAKAVNFGILYGQGPHGLSQSADIPYIKAKEFIDNYFNSYKKIQEYIDTTIEAAKKNGYVETLFGRRRYLPEINSSVMMVRKAAERMAVNTPLQGTAADLIKAAMIEIHKLLEKEDNAKMLLQVHDELILEIEEKEVLNISKEVKSIMENVLKLKVPIIAEIKAGKSWGEMKEIA